MLLCYLLTDLWSELEQRVASLPESMEQAAQKVKQAEEDYQKLLSLRTEYDDILYFLL